MRSVFTAEMNEPREFPNTLSISSADTILLLPIGTPCKIAISFQFIRAITTDRMKTFRIAATVQEYRFERCRRKNSLCTFPEFNTMKRTQKLYCGLFTNAFPVSLQKDVNYQHSSEMNEHFLYPRYNKFSGFIHMHCFPCSATTTSHMLSPNLRQYDYCRFPIP